MAVETQIATTSHGSLASMGITTKAFVLAHPVGVAIIGGVLIGVGTYYVVKKFRGKDKEQATSGTPAAA
ncbi:MAG: hypothetical protein GXP14_10625 [Gammaproteobacteria bacterium]|nr:hypothetical protein [Gammaproteobacteria bacterium]